MCHLARLVIMHWSLKTYTLYKGDCRKVAGENIPCKKDGYNFGMTENEEKDMCMG